MPRRTATACYLNFNKLVLVLSCLWGFGCGSSKGPISNKAEESHENAPRKQGEENKALLVDIQELEQEDRQSFLKYARTLYSPCDLDTSLRSCAAGCNSCKTAQTYLKRLVDEGYDKEEIEKFYELRFHPKEEVTFKGIAAAPAKGVKGAPITIVTFSDFECPHCRRAHIALQELMEKMPQKIRSVFLHFPLSTIHPQAEEAARAAVAAGKQKAFFSMVDKLFENQGNLYTKQLMEIAKELKLDLPTFRSDMRSEQSARVVQKDTKEGERLGLTGTPGIFINGRKFRESLDTLEDYILEIILE